jgi:hypothetical protein
MTGSMTGCWHLLHGVVANGARSPEINVLDLQRPQVTIFKGLLGGGVPILTPPK